jgi:hypothetical protein
MRTPHWTGATASPPNGSAEPSVKGTGEFCGVYIRLSALTNRLRWTAEVVGTDRMLYSTDYPYTFGTRPGGFPYLDTSGGVAATGNG